MSRSYKSNKAAGWEYWDREANSDGKHYSKPGKWAKQKLNKKRRRRENEQINSSQEYNK